MQNLSIKEREGLELVFEFDIIVSDGIDYDLYLLGKFKDFWVQVHDFPLGFASERLAKDLGNVLGGTKWSGSAWLAEGNSIVGATIDIENEDDCMNVITECWPFVEVSSMIAKVGVCGDRLFAWAKEKRKSFIVKLNGLKRKLEVVQESDYNAEEIHRFRNELNALLA
ncbi:hypothetical protein Gorai_016354 [Gossypium raimondii]|uniref:DUF4283 domain-containing protein n=1 Tax=Gossypium raimondii TaxID=29730 RepID=A0A7J8P8S7_GOSRA|nr:hypothetical protein [Gossypium raimondii]